MKNRFIAPALPICAILGIVACVGFPPLGLALFVFGIVSQRRFNARIRAIRAQAYADALAKHRREQFAAISVMTR